MVQTNKPNRLSGVDAARLLAVLGMFAAHIFPLFERAADGAYFPTITGVLASGRASVLFMVLAGLSLTLLVESLRRRGYSHAKVYSILGRRALLIAVLGMIIGPANEGVAVILVHYGLLFLLLLLALRVPRITLWVVSAVWLMIMPILWRPLAFAWAGESLHHNPTFLDLLTPRLLFTDLFVTGYYPLMVWIGYALLGLAVGRLALALPQTAVRLLVGGGIIAVLSYGAGWLLTIGQISNIASAVGIEANNVLALVSTGHLPRFTLDPFMGDSGYLWLPTGHSNSLINVLHSASFALALIGLMQLLIPRLGALGRCLAGAGRAPLTLYAGHLIFLPWLQVFLEPATIWWILCGTTAALGLWLGFTRHSGPLEYLVKFLSGADSLDPPRR